MARKWREGRYFFNESVGGSHVFGIMGRKIHRGKGTGEQEWEEGWVRGREWDSGGLTPASGLLLHCTSCSISFLLLMLPLCLFHSCQSELCVFLEVNLLTQKADCDQSGNHYDFECFSSDVICVTSHYCRPLKYSRCFHVLPQAAIALEKLACSDIKLDI